MSERDEKFTPGPWAINTGAAEDNVYVYVEEIESPHGMVAWAREPGQEMVTTHPDAHLIAAAPELYEALNAIVNRSVSGIHMNNLFAKGRAALAKARGEA